MTISVADEARHGHTIASTVTVTLKDGRALTRRVDSFKGTPEQPLDRAEMREKFLLLTRHCNQKAMTRLFERLQNLEAERNLDWIKIEAAKKNSGNARRAGGRPNAACKNEKRNDRHDRYPLRSRRIHLDRRRGGVVWPTAVSSHSRPRPFTALAPTPPTATAVAHLYAAKGRPAFNPLIAHVYDLAATNASRFSTRRPKSLRWRSGRDR